MDIHPFLKLRRSGWRGKDKTEGYCLGETHNRAFHDRGVEGESPAAEQQQE